MRVPTRPALRVGGPAFVACVRRRLLALDPGGAGLCTCPNVSAAGRCCGAEVMGDGGHHRLQCAAGGGLQRRHSSVVDALAAILRANLRVPVTLEQWIPGAAGAAGIGYWAFRS